MQPRYAIIANELKAFIQSGRYSNTNRLPTEFVLMDEYKVSRQTIRNALAILKKEGYIEKRRGSGSHIKYSSQPKRITEHHAIAVVTTYISNYIFPSILREVEDVLSRNNCMTLLFATQNQVSTERIILQRLLNSKIDGVIAEGTKTSLPNPNIDLYQKLIEKGIPVVFINGSYPQLTDSISVTDDNEAGGKMLVDYLVKKGHSKIAGIFKSDDMQGHGRYAGYSLGLREYSLDIDDSFVFWYNTDIRNVLFSEKVILPVLEEWARKGCTAIICYNDEIASQIITLLDRCNISVPAQMSIVSFDNSHLAEIGNSITSLSHQPYNVGRIAAEKLLQLLSGGIVVSEKLSWELVERSSSK